MPILGPKLGLSQKEPEEDLTSPSKLRLQPASDGLGRELSLSVAMAPDALEPHAPRHQALHGAESLPPHLQAKMDEFTRSLGLAVPPPVEPPSRQRASAEVAELADQLKESRGDANVLLEWVQDLTRDSERVKAERDHLLVRKNALQVENNAELATLHELEHRNKSLKKSLESATAKASAEEKGMLAQSSWLQACEKNRALRADLEKLRGALTMVRQQDGATLARKLRVDTREKPLK